MEYLFKFVRCQYSARMMFITNPEWVSDLGYNPEVIKGCILKAIWALYLPRLYDGALIRCDWIWYLSHVSTNN